MANCRWKYVVHYNIRKTENQKENKTTNESIIDNVLLMLFHYKGTRVEHL